MDARKDGSECGHGTQESVLESQREGHEQHAWKTGAGGWSGPVSAVLSMFTGGQEAPTPALKGNKKIKKGVQEAKCRRGCKGTWQSEIADSNEGGVKPVVLPCAPSTPMWTG